MSTGWETLLRDLELSTFNFERFFSLTPASVDTPEPVSPSFPYYHQGVAATNGLPITLLFSLRLLLVS